MRRLRVPPPVQLKMGARGVVIDPAHPLLSTTWAFGTVAQGATGVYGLGIWNLGNAPAVMTMPLNNISDTLFGISAVDGSGNPVAGTVTVAAGDGFFSAGTSIAGTFTPIDQQGSWTDTGTLTIVPGQRGVLRAAACELGISGYQPFGLGQQLAGHPTRRDHPGVPANQL